MNNLHNVGVLVVVVLLAAIIVVSFWNAPESVPGDGLESSTPTQAGAPGGDGNESAAGGSPGSEGRPDEQRGSFAGDLRSRFVELGGQDPARREGLPAARDGGPGRSSPPLDVATREPEGDQRGRALRDTPARPASEKSPEPKPEARPSGSFPRTVTLGKRDRIWDLAVSTYGPRMGPAMVPRIMAANDISDARRLRAGMEISLPAPEDALLKKARSPRKTEHPVAVASSKTSGEPSGGRSRGAGASLPFLPEPQAFSGGSGGEGGTYVVQPGESLGGIAQRLLGSVSRAEELARLNGIKDPDLIREGMRLKLPD